MLEEEIYDGNMKKENLQKPNLNNTLQKGWES